MEAISGGTLDALEARVDAWRASTPVPQWSLQRAQWNLLSVLEDMLRMRLAGVMQGSLDAGQYVQLIDDYKYTLKYALAHVGGLAPAALRERPDLDDQEEYGAALDMLEAHEGYNDAVAAFSGVRAGLVRCFRDAAGRYRFESSHPFERQANDLLESRSEASSGTPLELIARFLYREADALPPALAACVHNVSRIKGEVRVRIPEALFDELDRLLGPRRTPIPKGWTCALGTAEQLTRAFRNLSIVAIAHVVAITNGAMAASVPGKPNGHYVRWLLGEATPKWLTSVLARAGGPTISAASDLVTLLTFGAGTTHPDPALQFLFPLRQGLIAVPWFMFATCNAERNLLTLLARARKADFDAASDAFEHGMFGELRMALASRTYTARLSTMVPGKAEVGEVDAILVDPVSAFILVVEMRWFIEPSEVREVQDRQRECISKTAQARRKRDAVRIALTATLREFEIHDRGQTWTIESVAVFDNFLPTPVDDIPCVSKRAFLSGIYREATLGGLWAWLQSGEWLPRRDVDFAVAPVDTTLGTVDFQIDGVNPTDEGDVFIRKRDQQLLAAYDSRG